MAPRRKTHAAAVLEAAAPEPNGQPEPAAEPQPRSVAEMPEVFTFNPAEQVILDGYAERYRAIEAELQRQLQENPQLKQLESQLVGAVHYVLRSHSLAPEDYDTSLIADQVMVRRKVAAVPMPEMSSEVPPPA